MAQVTLGNLELLNKLTEDGDRTRGQVTSAILTVYSAAISGLFLIVTNSPKIKLSFDSIQRVLFIFIALSGVIIVLLCLIEKLASLFAKFQVGKSHAKNIREGKTATRSNPVRLSANKLTTKVLIICPWALLMMVSFNAISVGWYIVNRTL